MNILLGPKWRRYHYDNNRIKLLDEEGGKISFSFDKGNFEDLLSHLPTNWPPDLILLERPEYLTFPLGIENSDYPVVAMVGDWNICFRVLQDNLKRFDWIVVDQKGVNVFKEAGYQNVDYFPVYGFNPAVHRLLEGYDRIYDILMIGNFNHEFQRERAKWLKRLTRINPKYNVRILSNIFGEEYVRNYNKAKIIFNRSIRGEMNERAYEAPANGALLFYEEENLEIRNFLIPGEECMLYNESNFEELIEHYLTHEEERSRIAKAGNRKIQQFSYERQLCHLIELLKSRHVFSNKKEYRVFSRLSESEQVYQNAKLVLQEISPNRLKIAEEMLNNVVKLDPHHYEARNALSMIYMLYFEQAQKQSQISKDLFDQAMNSYIDIIDEIPDAALVHYNIACVCQAEEQYDLAEAEYKKALATTQNDEPLVVRDYFFPRDYVTFRIEWEKISALYCGDLQKQDKALKGLLRWQCCFLLGGLCLIGRRVDEALAWYNQAVAARPDLAARARLKIGEVLGALGRYDAALEEFEKTLILEPFNTDAWKANAKLLNRAEKYKDCVEFFDELFLLIERCPFYSQEKKWVVPLYEEAQKRLD